MITASRAARAQKLTGNKSCFVLLRQVPGVAAAKGTCNLGNHDLLGLPCFVAASLLTAEMMM